MVNGVSRSGKTNALLNSRSDRPDIDKTYLYAKDISEPKYKLLIKKRHEVGLKQYNDSKTFIKYSNDMDGIFENIEEYNANCRNTKY